MTMIFSIITLLVASATDTLTSAYSDLWQGVQDPEHGNVIMQAMASQGLIYVVLGVSLIIWFVLIGYLVRLDKKITNLEQKLPE